MNVFRLATAAATATGRVLPGHRLSQATRCPACAECWAPFICALCASHLRVALKALFLIAGLPRYVLLFVLTVVTYAVSVAFLIPHSVIG